jgi:hypothetical protein
MPQFQIAPSPSPDAALAPYDAELFPKFKLLFGPFDESSRLHFLHKSHEDAETSVVLENRSEKAITALRCRWIKLDGLGKSQNHLASNDAYTFDTGLPVLAPGARQLISLSGNIDESIIDHVLAGGGCIHSSSRSATRALETEIIAIHFEIDFILFADGEIAGPDQNKYRLELNCRKPAAEFVARHIRLAESEGRDATPVLSALEELPVLRKLDEPKDKSHIYWIRHYAGEYLRYMKWKPGDNDFLQRRLRSLENRPALPKFYWREDAANADRPK